MGQFQGLKVSGAVLIMLASPTLLSAAEVARDLEQIRSCTRANLPETSFSQQIELTSWDAAGGQRSLRGQLYGEKQSESRVGFMLSLEHPRDLNGARYLLNRRNERDDMYVYLPAMQRTRRISGGMRGQPLWGTDFSYEDIKHLQATLGSGDTDYLGDSKIEGRAVHQLRVIPAAAEESAYSSVEVDIDRLTCLVLQARFSDSSGVFKRLDSDPATFSQLGSRWISGRVVMQNLRSRTRSVLELSDYTFDDDLSNTRFSPNTFHLAP